MIHVARDVFEKNQVKVDSYCLHSSKFTHPQPVDLIVSETLDCAVFGERFISSVVDLNHRLTPSSRLACVLPAKATIYLAICESAIIEDMHFTETTNGNQICLLSNECYVNCPTKEERIQNDPYDSIQLDEIEGEYKLLSEPVEAFSVDFNDFNYLKNVILKDEFCKSIKLKATQPGRACCLIGWFR